MLSLVDSVGHVVIAPLISLIIGSLQRKWVQSRDQKYDLGEHFHFCRRQKWKCVLGFWLLTSGWKSVASTVTEWIAWRKWKCFWVYWIHETRIFFIYIQKKIAETNNLAIFGCSRAEVTCRKWHECVFFGTACYYPTTLMKCVDPEKPRENELFAIKNWPEIQKI